MYPKIQEVILMLWKVPCWLEHERFQGEAQANMKEPWKRLVFTLHASDSSEILQSLAGTGKDWDSTVHILPYNPQLEKELLSLAVTKHKNSDHQVWKRCKL